MIRANGLVLFKSQPAVAQPTQLEGSSKFIVLLLTVSTTQLEELPSIFHLF